jgi:hypothetical protein
MEIDLGQGVTVTLSDMFVREIRDSMNTDSELIKIAWKHGRLSGEAILTREQVEAGIVRYGGIIKRR